MNQPKLETLTIVELVSRFTALGVEEEDAYWKDQVAKCNRLRLQRLEIGKELKKRPGDQRRALLSLYDHPNLEVRLLAAKLTLAVEPEKARRLIEAIAASHRFPQAGDAGMCLTMLDRGIFVPD
jgi:Domain of unknown function (DUF2019)